MPERKSLGIEVAYKKGKMNRRRGNITERIRVIGGQNQ